MSLNPDAAKPKAYRLRLLQVLLAADLHELGFNAGNVIDTRYCILQAWNAGLELRILMLIERRLRQ